MSSLQSTYNDESGLLTIAFEKDLDGEVVFMASLFRELRELLEKAEQSKKTKGILLKLEGRGKRCAGYPVGELLAMDENEVRRFCYEGQEALKKLSGLAIFTCCLLEGTVSGPALEIALSCSKRIMSLEEGSQIQLPEIGMGIFPPLGSVYTLIEELGTGAALDLLLSCESLSPARALELGLADHLARSDEMEDAAGALLSREDAAGNGEEDRPETLRELVRSIWSRSRLRNFLFLRSQVKKARQTLSPGVREAYLGLVGMLREGLSAGEDEGLMIGARNFTDLVHGAPSRNLLTLAGTGAHLRRWLTRVARPLESSHRLVTVIGDSRRAVEWVLLFSAEGFAVRLVTGDAAKSGHFLKERLKGREGLSRRIFPSTHSEGLLASGLVIAAPEETNAEKLGEDMEALVAGTSASLPIAIDTACLSGLVCEIPFPSRHRVYGVSRFRFVQGKGIIEISLGAGAEEESLPLLLSFFHSLEPLTVLVRESPAGISRRVLTSYVTEALRLVGEGAGILRVEEVALNSGIPVGPFWMLDVLGLPEYMGNAGFLKQRLGPRFAPPETALRLKEMGIEGRDGAKGFYHRADGELWLDESLTRFHGNRADAGHHDETIQERLLFAIVAEALRAFGEGVSSNPEVVDCALDALGIFPSHLGGPLHYAGALGTPPLIRKFEKMARAWGASFEPPEFLYASLGAGAHVPAKDTLPSRNRSYHSDTASL
jgi:3-hydroxyacyl-CoA dehydrogenase/enoyl-CoA hydratase/3-hydroxybutyryl-CoA epimerase